MTKRTERAVIAAIVIVYLLLAAGYALRVPAWLAPDEPAHYHYIAQVADSGCCPVIEAGDWDQAYLSALTAADFAPALLDRFDAIQYEDHQPPLYYLLASPVFRLTGGSLAALRLFTALIGAGVVIAAYAVGRALLPDQPQIALGAAALVAFVPQHVHILASVNNDALAELVIGWALWAGVRHLKSGSPSPWLLGVLVGIGLLTKVSTLFLVGLIPLAILFRQGRGGGRRRIFTALALFAVPALLLGGVWWMRNFGVYGFPDLFGLRAHDAVVIGQPRTAELIAQVGIGETLRQIATTTFQSFWGQFGWMELALPAWTYGLIGAFLALALIGLLALVPRRGRAWAQTPRETALAWAGMGAALLLALAQFAYYNLTFQQFQGRYLYPGLIPLALFAAAGIDALRGRLTARAPIWLTPALIGWLAALTLFLLWRVVPGLAG
ncbi:MAG: glycosyltransferase family 39 protein [Anaerolineae bacterium]|nr:glycosyltransferase family 39 protein [Anaerolineae bacterium]NUQ06901.1 glycosyltransferase family 39 protein [Anaerolineae bacterium]